MAYDPGKRHDYYMRTRQLKGRKPANPSKAQEAFRAGENNFGKADLARAHKQVEQRVSKLLDKMISQKHTLDKLEKDGKRDTPQYQSLLADYVKTIKTLSLNDPQASWTDSKRIPEFNNAQKLKALLDKMPNPGGG